jgi:hypothetical protein
MTPQPEPRTAAGRALLDDIFGETMPIDPSAAILAIEAQAASPDSEALDVERLVRAIQAEDLNRGYRARAARVYRDQAKFIAAAYAALTPEAKDTDG